MLTNFNDQDLADIAAYFSSQKGSVGAADPKLVERGRALFNGGDTEKACRPAPVAIRPMAQASPWRASRTWGQHAQYVAKQLTDFREGNRTNDGDAMTMRSIAGKLSNKDIEALASYIQGLH